ncbi:MAG: F0F1 ATP synthase subunit B [bacterium]|nr:F0F1 ATP synthase subunit B [bacterium]
MISINIYEIFMQIINFIILLWIINYLLVKPIIAFIKKRESAIKTNLESAEQSKIKTQETLNEQKEALKEARREARNIMQRAEDDTNKERSIARQQAKAEAERLIENAKKEMDLDVLRVKNELKKYFSDLTVSLTEKIIKTNIDKKSQEKVIEEYLSTIKN